MAELDPTAKAGTPGLVITQIMVRDSLTICNSSVGSFWIDHNHGGYSSIFPLLLASMNTKIAGTASLLDSAGNPESLAAKVQVDWFRWPG